MDPYGVMIKKTFDSFKCKSKEDLLKCIPFYDNEDHLCGFLRPITQDYRITLPDCGKLLSAWRNENPSMSAEEFRATEAGTEKWLDKLVLDREDRILFLILGLKGEKIGHMGYSSFQYAQKSCEIDAVLRGDKTAFPGIMTFSLRSLIEWGLRDLKLENITLRVFSDNIHAIQFYKRNDFILDENVIQEHLESGKRYLGMQIDWDAWENNHK